MGCVLVTGCSSGIGLATAQAFARGGRPVLAGVRRPDSVPVVAEACDGLPVSPIVLDVTSGPSVEEATARAVADHGTVDVLVNNAGVGVIRSIEETGEDVYRQLFETNVFGPLAMMRAVVPPMREAGGGVIVNVSSVLGRVAIPFQGIYCATKFALEAVSDALHLEVAGHGIRVAVVEPGRVLTSFQANLVDERPGPESPYAERQRAFEEGWTRLPGRDRLATADEVAEMVLAACAPDGPRHLPVGQDSVGLVARREELDPDGIERYLRSVTGLVD